MERTATFRLSASPSIAFPLFSPEGERRWARGWEPEYLHGSGDSPAAGTTLRTRAGGELTLWLVLRYDPVGLAADYVRVTPDSRMGTVHVRCGPAPDSAGAETEVEVTYKLTALSPAGTEVLEALTADAYEAMMAEWREACEESVKGDGVIQC